MQRFFHQILILLTPDQVLFALQAISDWSPIVDCSVILGTDASLEVPVSLSWLKVVKAGSLAALCQADGLPQEVTEQFNYALLQDASVLYLKGTMADAEDKLQSLVQLLDGIRHSGDQLRYFYDESSGPLILDVIRTEPVGEPITGHGSTIENTAYSFDGQTFLTNSRDETAKVWDVARWKVLHTLRARRGMLEDVSFSPDGQTILATDGHALVRLWDARSGKERLCMPGIQARFSPDGSMIGIIEAVEDPYTLRVRCIDAQTGQEQIAVDDQRFAFSPDGTTLLTSNLTSGTSTVWNIRSGQSRFGLPVQLSNNMVKDFAYSPDGKNIAIVDNADVVRVWEVETARKLLEAHASYVTYSPDGQQFVTSIVQANQSILVFWDVNTWKVKEGTLNPKNTYHIDNIVFSPDGQTFITIIMLEYNKNFRIQVWDSRTIKVIFSFIVNDKAYNSAISYSHDSARLLVSCSQYPSEDENEATPSVIHGFTEVWDVQERKRLFALVGIHPVYSSDGRQLVTVLNDGRMAIWEASSGKLLILVGQIRALLHVRNTGLGGTTPLMQGQAEKRVERFADVRYPQQVRARQKFALQVGLLQHFFDEAIVDAQPAGMMVTVDANGNKTGAKPVQVTLFSPGFLISANSIELEVYADKDTPSLSFQLEPKPGATSLQPVHVTFYQGQECLGEVIAVIDILSDILFSEQRFETLRMTLREPPRQKWGPILPPDVILYVTRQKAQGCDKLSFQYEWVQENWPKQDGGEQYLETSVEAWAEVYYKRLGLFANASKNGQVHGIEDDPRELEKIGENLYHDLFTPQLKQFYQQCAPTARSMLIYSNEPWIPWEVIKPWGEGLDKTLSDFLCSHFQLSRWYTNSQGRRIQSAIGLQILGAVIPPTGLQYVGDEANYLKRLPRDWPPLSLEVLSNFTGSALLGMMQKGTVNLFHFATHGIKPEVASPIAAISLGKDAFLVSDLVGLRVESGLSASAPLIFMNACHSGRQGQGLTRLEGWADRFISLGCSGFIGANWAIHDELASRFATTFYNALQARSTIAQAMQKARFAIREQNPSNSTWLAYSLYAHPNLRVYPSKPPGS